MQPLGQTSPQRRRFDNKVSALMLILEISMLTTSLVILREERVWVLNSGAEMQHLPIMKLLMNIKFACARRNHRCSKLDAMHRSLCPKFDKEPASRFPNGHWTFLIPSMSKRLMLDHIKINSRIGLTCGLKMFILLWFRSKVLCSGPTVYWLSHVLRN